VVQVVLREVLVVAVLQVQVGRRVHQELQVQVVLQELAVVQVHQEVQVVVEHQERVEHP
jgi:hypothetical protein